MADTKIPCSINILTLNNIQVIHRCLETLTEFGEVVVSDGGSTDGTLEVCELNGCKVISQSDKYLYQNNAIKDFSGVRNDLIAASSFEWILCVDSDEFLEAETIEKIRNICIGHTKTTNVLRFNRVYVVAGQKIDNCITYPSIQVRMFKKSKVRGFINDIHEVLLPLDPKDIETVNCTVMVPLPSTDDLKEKWLGYIDHIVKTRHANMTFDYKYWFRGTIVAYAITIILSLKYFVTYKLFSKGVDMPVRYELLRIWYYIKVPKDITLHILMRKIRKNFVNKYD